MKAHSTEFLAEAFILLVAGYLTSLSQDLSAAADSELVVSVDECSSQGLTVLVINFDTAFRPSVLKHVLEPIINSLRQADVLQGG